jgi:hypothetical protein
MRRVSDKTLIKEVRREMNRNNVNVGIATRWAFKRRSMYNPERFRRICYLATGVPCIPTPVSVPISDTTKDQFDNWYQTGQYA